MSSSPCQNCGSTDSRKKVSKNGNKYYNAVCDNCINDYKLEYRKRIRADVFMHYGNECVCCEEKTEQFLSIDHINNDASEDVWDSGRRITGWAMYIRIKQMDYPLDYQLLCMNCNFGKRMNNGVCPHETDKTV